MTDKVQKIREELERLKLCTMDEHMKFYSESAEAEYNALCKIDAYIDSLEEEPVNSIWHDASEKSNEPEEVVIINPSDNTGDVLTRCTGVYQGRIWAYTSELLKFDNSCKIGKNLQKEPVSEDLDEAADNALSNVLNTHEIVNVRSCLEMFRFGAEWQKEYMEKEYSDLNKGLVSAKGVAVYMAYETGKKDIIGNVRSILNKVAYRNNGLDVNGDYCEQPYVELDNEFKKLLKEG